MQNSKQTLQQCTKLVEAASLAELLRPIWRAVEWHVHAEDMAGGASLDQTSDNVIHLYPSLADPQPVLREFGRLLLRRAGDRGIPLWQNKLDAPTAGQVATAAAKLNDPQLRGTCKCYNDVLDTYPSTGQSVDRLVYINLVNALLANNISYADSEGVDIMTWGPTTAYAKREKYHCLIPLVSAYSPPDVSADFGAALAALVTDNLAGVRDGSVAFALRGIIQRIARIAIPE